MVLVYTPTSMHERIILTKKFCFTVHVRSNIPIQTKTWESRTQQRTFLSDIFYWDLRICLFCISLTMKDEHSVPPLRACSHGGFIKESQSVEPIADIMLSRTSFTIWTQRSEYLSHPRALYDWQLHSTDRRKFQRFDAQSLEILAELLPTALNAVRSTNLAFGKYKFSASGSKVHIRRQ